MTNLLDRWLAPLEWLPPLLARIVVGWVFVVAGWGKLHNLDKVIEFFTGLGIPAPHLQAPFVAGTELIGGALILVGLLTRLAAVPLIGVMAVALLTALRDQIGSLGDLFGLSEFLYVALLVGLVVSGAGAVSVDAILRRTLGRTTNDSR